MGQTAKTPRGNRTLTVDFQDEATYFRLINDGTAFVECGRAFILSLGFQLTHNSTCHGGDRLPRHSHDVRIRLGGLTLWRLQCPRCQAVVTVRPHCVLRDRQMRPDVARDALVATHGGRSRAGGATLCHMAPMARERVLCAFGPPRLVAGLTRCGLRLPADILADAQHRRCLTDQGSLPTSVSGRVRWPRGDSASQSAAAFTQSYGVLQPVALAQEPSDRVQGARTEGCDSPVSSRRTLWPRARLGSCRRHALNQLPHTLLGVSAPVRPGFRAPCHTRRHRCRQRHSLRVVAWGQRLRHCAAHSATTVGDAQGARVRSWLQAQKAGGDTVRADPQLPAMSTVLEQAHHASARTLVALQGCHHPGGRPAAFLTGLAHLYNLIP